MVKNKLKMFGQLYKKDIHQLLPELIIVIAISAVLDIWMFFGSDRNWIAVLIVLMMMNFGLAGLLPLVSSFRIFKQEWSYHTVYLLKSLPVSGIPVIGAKLLALMTQYAVGTLVTGIGSAWAIYSIIPADRYMPEIQSIVANPDTYKMIGLIFLLVFSGMLCLLGNSLFSQMAGRMSKKHSGLITLSLFIALIWMVGKIAGMIGSSVEGKWLNIQIQPGLLSSYFNSAVVHYSLLFTLFYLAVAGFMFAAAVMLYDRYIEV